jgi:hypothetical protein
MKIFNSKILLGLLFVSFLFSCTDDENKEVSPLIGKYKLIEYQSQTEIDLNADGLKSTDLLLELEELYFNDNYYVDNLIDHELSISDYYNIRMYTRLVGLSSLDDIPYSSTYGSSWLNYELKLNNDLITVTDFERIPNPISYSSELEEITLIESNLIQIKSSQSFIDYSDNEIKRIQTVATFRRLENEI